VNKAKRVAEELELPKGSYTVMECELNSLQATADFADAVLKLGRRIDVLCCNAALYLPNQQAPTFTKDGYETSFGVNHLAHYLLVKKLLPTLAKTKGSRCVIVGSITGNSNTVGGGAVLPLADLGRLSGLDGPAAGKGVAMLDGKPFNGAKAYKDAKLCNMMSVLELHRRYHVETGISFTSMYPGCIAETALFRQKRGWFRWFFPIFMKYVTGGYVSEAEAGERLAQTIADPATAKSGVYWSWNGGARTVGWYDFKAKGVVGSGGAGGDLFENEPSGLVTDKADAKKLFDFCDAAIVPFNKPAPPPVKKAGTAAFA
jgi:protochlorophyllide reductase